MPFPKFLKGTVSSTEDIDFPPVAKSFAEMIIPCLSAPNVPWPEYLERFGLNLSNLKRTPNGDKIEFCTRLTTECKCETGQCKC